MTFSAFFCFRRLNEYFEVNTTSLRHSLWFFVQSVFGACHEDMRMERVNKLLTKEQCCYLKTCATRPFDLIAYPSTVSREIFAALSPSEVVSYPFTKYVTYLYIISILN